MDLAEELEPSTADLETVDLYTACLCHAFAVALHRRTGWRIAALIDHETRFWEDDEDQDNYIPAVVHVVVVDEQDRAWDVKGVRRAADLAKEWEADGNDLSFEDVGDEASLMETYVAKDGDEIDRPLGEITECDVERADAVAARVLGAIEGFATRGRRCGG